MAEISGFAIAGLIFGILSLFIAWLPLFGLLFVILTLIICFLALNKIKKKKLSGQGMAIAGLVMGFLGLIPALIITVGMFGVASLITSEELPEEAIAPECISKAKELIGSEILIKHYTKGSPKNCELIFPDSEVLPIRSKSVCLDFGKEVGQNKNCL